MSKKQTKSKLFDDITLAYGLIKRMNGFCFCFTGDQELVRLGFMIKKNPTILPYVTVKGKKFLMEAIKPLAENIPEDKPKEDDEKDKREKVAKLVKNLQNTPVRGYWEPDEDEEDEDDEEDFKKKEKPEKVENDSQA